METRVTLPADLVHQIVLYLVMFHDSAVSLGARETAKEVAKIGAQTVDELKAQKMW